MFKVFQSLLSAVTLTSLFFSFIVTTKGNIQAVKQSAPTPAAAKTSQSAVKADYGKTALLFEMNKGQTDKAVKFVSRGAGYTLYLTEKEVVFSLKFKSPNAEAENLPESPKTAAKTKSDVLKMRFDGANPESEIAGETQAVAKTNYYTGKKRFENVPNYQKVNYKNLYDGIDAVFYADADNQLEYDFVVAPQADANRIALTFDGADNISIDELGNLVIKTANAALVQPKPFTYQEIDGERREIASRYVLADEKTIKFEIGEYDKSTTLTIDPKISYLTYLGGSSFDIIHSIEVDAAGNVYVSGASFSTDFPSPNSLPGNTGSAAFVAKLDPTGRTLLYTTFLDGELDDGNVGFVFGNSGTALAVDADGRAYIGGFTDSEDFPVTENAYQKRKGICGTFMYCVTATNEEGFVAKLNADGTVFYSTYLGGGKKDAVNAIAVDSAGRAYVAGITLSGAGFPTPHGFQGTSFGSFDAFLTVFNADGSDIIYSTGFGGGGVESAFGIALDSSNNVYITGETDSGSGFPTRNAFQPTSGGGTDAFVAKFNTSLSGNDSLIYSTFVGGSGGDAAKAIAVFNGKAHITGVTGSFNFPLLGAIDSTNQVNEAFVTVLNANGSLANSTFLGGNDRDTGNGIDVDKAGNIYVTGGTDSADFPTALSFQSTQGAGAFLTKLRFDGANGITRGILASSLLTGNNGAASLDVAVLNSRVAFIAGVTDSTDLPTTPGALKETTNQRDGFVARILDTHLDSVGVFRLPSFFQITQSTTNVVAQIIDFGLSGQRGVAGDWNGDGIRTVGHFTNGVWKYRNINSGTSGAVTVNFGQAGDLPVVGDWNGDGIETPGVFRPSVGKFFLTNTAAANPPIEITINFGIAEDLPVAGDWNGDGVDSIGVFRPSSGQFFLTDDNIIKATIDQTFFFGVTGDQPTAGDWDGNGVDTIAVYRPSTTEFFLTNDNINIDEVFLFGIGNQPIAGDWDGLPLP